MRRKGKLGTIIAALAVMLGMSATGASAQIWPPNIDPDESEEAIDFERPESWAMARITHATQMTAMGTDPYEPFPGRLGMDFAIEAIWIPSFSDEQRRVGFDGQYQQNLNWSSVAGRIRLGFRGAAGWFAEVGLVPPLQIGELQPLFIDGAFGLRVAINEESRAFLRVHGQDGQLRGDIVCPEGVSGEDDPETNPLDCHGSSSDQISTSTLGIEVGGDYQVGEWHPHLSGSVQYLRPEYRMGARYHGNEEVDLREDRRRLATEGVTWSVMGGVTYAPRPDIPLTLEAAYTPLTVDRPGAGEQRDGVFNIRLLLRSRVR